MIGNERVLGVIPARGGSKGVPRKNIRQAYGRPLIAWSIEAAKGSAYIDRIIVSTDSEEIAEVARRYGGDVPFMRPPELATDTSPGVGPALHALESLPEFSWVVLLQPTSPLRKTSDIDECIQSCISRAAPSCVSVSEMRPPELAFRVASDSRISPILSWESCSARRQDLPKAFGLNGAVYVAQANWLRKSGGFVGKETVAHVMAEEVSLDIDSELDFAIFEAIMANRKGNHP